MNARQREKALVQAMLDGDRSAFDDFCLDYVPQVYRFAMRRLQGDVQLAEEVAQSTVCKAIAKLESFRGEAALVTWLFAVCRNEIAMYFRQRERRGVHMALDAVGQAFPSVMEDPSSPSPETAVLRSEGQALVHDILDSLPPRYGRALEMKYIEDLPTKDVAQRLGIGLKAAESLLTRARQHFRTRFNERRGPPAEASATTAPVPQTPEQNDEDSRTRSTARPGLA